MIKRIQSQNQIFFFCRKKKIYNGLASIPLIVVLLLTSQITLATEISWINKNPSQTVPPHSPWKFMYHPPSKDLILFGETETEGEYLWKYNVAENRWLLVEVTEWEIFPKKVWSMAYDSKNDIFIIFGGGGMDGSVPAQTWAFNYTSKVWTNQTPSINPPKRIMSNMIYDTQSEKIVMYGGLSQFFAPNIFYNDTWTYDYLTNTWTNVTPSMSPEARAKAAMVYDSMNDKILLFGGFTEKVANYEVGGLKQDLWTFDLETTTWSEITTAVRPPARAYHSMVFDSFQNQVVLFGGDRANFLPSSDTWIYNYTANTWSELITESKPPARWSTGMVFDPNSNQTILFGGQIAEYNVVIGDTWILGSNNPTTTTLTTTTAARFSEIIIFFLGVGVLIIVRKKRGE